MKTIEKTKVMKKEKRVKTVPTQEQIDKMVLDYLQSSEKHLFQSRYVWDEKYKEGDYYKVIPVILNGDAHYIKIEISNNEIKFINIKGTSWIKTKNHLGMFKDLVFPQEKKHKSVRGYNSGEKVKLNERFSEIKSIAELNPDISAEDLKKLIVI